MEAITYLLFILTILLAVHLWDELKTADENLDTADAVIDELEQENDVLRRALAVSHAAPVMPKGNDTELAFECSQWRAQAAKAELN